MRNIRSSIALLLCVLFFGTGCANSSTENENTVRVGYFPNMTHAQALIGLADGSFQKQLGPEMTIEPTQFNAGPQEIEALLAGQIDIGYVGPSPAVNGYIQSNGEALRIISGATANGVAIVGQPDLVKEFAEKGPDAFIGKRIASPQQGNTQDIALRAYLAENQLTDKVEIVPIANADQLTLFSQGEIDASWAPEPWGSRLIQEAGAKLLFTEDTLWPNKEFATTVVVVRTEFLQQHPDVVRKWLEAHAQVTEWANQNPKEAQALVNQGIEKATTKKLDDAVLKESWGRMEITTDPLQSTIETSAQKAKDLGFIQTENIDLSHLFDLNMLNEITSQ